MIFIIFSIYLSSLIFFSTKTIPSEEQQKNKFQQQEIPKTITSPKYLWRRWRRDEERGGGGQLLPAAEEMPEVDVKEERDG